MSVRSGGVRESTWGCWWNCICLWAEVFYHIFPRLKLTIYLKVRTPTWSEKMFGLSGKTHKEKYKHVKSSFGDITEPSRATPFRCGTHGMNACGAVSLKWNYNCALHNTFLSVIGCWEGVTSSHQQTHSSLYLAITVCISSFMFINHITVHHNTFNSFKKLVRW